MRLTAVHHDRDHVEAHRRVERAGACGVDFRGATDAALLALIDRLLRRAGAYPAARLDLDKDQAPALRRDQIDFGTRGAKVALENPVASPPEITLGIALASPAEPPARIAALVGAEDDPAQARPRFAPSARESSQM